jgi:uncharacterized membrane protein YfcA
MSSVMPPPAPSSAPSFARVALIGLAAGLLSGLFGVGGGILIVPALVFGLGLDQRLAHGTSLAAIIPISIAGVITFQLADRVDWVVAAWLTLGALAGAVIGTTLLQRIPRRPLIIGFSALLTITIIRLTTTLESSRAVELDAAMAMVLAVTGLASGVLAGLLGVGGGIIMVPAMIVLLGIDPVVAKGTSLAVIVPTAIVGTLRNRSHANADLRIAATIGVGGVVTAAIGALIAAVLSANVSNLLLAGLLLVVLARELLSLRGAP